MISLPDGQRIGMGAPCFVIAEAGVNHNGELEMARQLIDAATAAGASAVKFQTFKAERLVTLDAPKAGYQKLVTRAAESQYEMLRRLELSSGAHRELMAYCRSRGLLFMSTPFDEESADFLDELGVALFKLPSGEVTNLPFLAHVARKSKPMIVSTGMADLNEVAAAVRTIEDEGLRELVLLHCVSSYPAEAKDINLRAMLAMNVAFGVPVGYSDHASGAEVALAAVALGACVIEKHLTLDRNLPGPDHQASLEPAELKALVTGIRTVEAALGDGVKRPAASEFDTAQVARKSLVAARDIPAGTTLTGDLIAIMRPGTGLAPSMRSQLIGRTVRVGMPKGTLFDLEKLA
jgi:N-acetylneuraminate synthase/N,N'-diacetyllegionaminate synthase